VTPPVDSLWVYLRATPLFWLTITIVAYLAADAIHRAARRNPLVNPVALSVLLLIGLLLATDTRYETYFDGAQFVHFLLGPATVALALPLHENWALVRRSIWPMAAALLAGSVTAVVSAVGIALALGASRETVLSLAPKSVTTPVAMGISEQLGGIPSLTAVLVILTGITGAMIGGPLLDLLRQRDRRARGFAVGIAAHGIGTARAFQDSAVAGTFAGVAMALNAAVTAIVVPLLHL
jgi:predicted murein hydrolase (TIGR00659 family)